ncbi:branched-chain amino acid ABC transporter permease [Halomarina litorea]|uniref:branched-chain amino acid ABC transporter permease n=1 Tax=Halomarina litorea TaxID=2961595 RepID=UPI0020C58DD7|nr:branched-chain amino acid ABC transporter permease [Halomarina sp. BCD28]
MAVGLADRFEDRTAALRLGLALLGVAAFALLPQVLSNFETGLVVEFLILLLFAASYDLLIGFTGVVSFGHALPYGVGAYFMGIAMSGRPLPGIPEAGLSLPVAVVLALVAVVLVSLITGWLAFQLSGVYFAMLTLAFSMVGYFVVFESTGITGGDNGLLVFRPDLLGLPLGDYVTFYYLVFWVVLVSFLAMRRLTNSPFGRVLVCIRENEERARFLGYDTFRYKLGVFVVAGLFAGIAGLLQGLYLQIVTPDLLYWSTGGDALLVTLIGGMGTLWGAAVGAAFLLGARELLTGIVEGWPIVLGVVYVLFVLFVPHGIAGLLTGKGEARSVWDVVGDLRSDDGEGSTDD